MPSFLSSFADKAQSAINATPLGQHLPGHGRPGSPDAGTQPTANQAAAQGGKSHTFETLQHQIRTFGQQYSSSTTPVQRIITTEKGVAIDLDSLSRDSKAQSKELYTWGQTESDDVKDVSDRLAYLNFVQGSLASSLAVKLDAARAPLKTLRDAETALTPRRNVRGSLHAQLTRIEHDNQKGMEKKVSELKEQIRKAESDDQAQEREVELLKRKALRESEQLKWEALREYGEKLVLLSQAATPIIQALPTLPPSATSPYTGGQATGAARASLQRALDNYKTGHINLPPHVVGSDLSRSDTRSFGESHASELSSMSSDITAESLQPGLPLTPPVTTHPLPSKSQQSSSPPTKSQSPPINPSNLNLSPTPIPDSGNSVSSAVPAAPITSPDSTKPSPLLPAVTPTVAETGVPVVAGNSGPGPSSGSLHDPKGPPTPQQTYGQGGKWESAEEEKKRLQTYSEVYGQTQSSSGPHHESAEDEKKRLEREERERVLHSGGQAGPHKEDGKKGDDDLPPYQDI